MTAQTKIRITDGQQLGIDRAVRIMAGGASFAQRCVLEDKGPRLRLMALAARFVQADHRDSFGRFHDVQAVRIVALHAIHLAFRDGMMLGKVEFGIDVQVAFVTSLRILARVDDELLPPGASHCDMFAGRAVARFTSVLARRLAAFKMQPRMGAGGERPGDVRVTIETGFVAYKSCALNDRGRHHRSLDSGTGFNQQSQCAKTNT